MARKSLLDRIALFGRSGLDVVQALGALTDFLWHVLIGRGGAGTGLHLLVKQLYSVGVFCRWRLLLSQACLSVWCWRCKAIAF